MIFVDTNVPMYLIGADHPNKVPCRAMLERYAREQQPLVTDAEVFQEILHRYCLIKRLAAVQDAFEAMLKIVDRVFSVELRDVSRAKEILLDERRLSARDAIHLAVMERQGITRMMSFDQIFDRVPGITRISS